MNVGSNRSESFFDGGDDEGLTRHSARDVWSDNVCRAVNGCSSVAERQGDDGGVYSALSTLLI